jgi:hypothetical protein
VDSGFLKDRFIAKNTLILIGNAACPRIKKFFVRSAWMEHFAGESAIEYYA